MNTGQSQTENEKRIEEIIRQREAIYQEKLEAQKR